VGDLELIRFCFFSANDVTMPTIRRGMPMAKTVIFPVADGVTLGLILKPTGVKEKCAREEKMTSATTFTWEILYTIVNRT